MILLADKKNKSYANQNTATYAKTFLLKIIKKVRDHVVLQENIEELHITSAI